MTVLGCGGDFTTENPLAREDTAGIFDLGVG